MGKLKATTLKEYDESISNQYIALSYVWEDKSDRQTAFVNGKIFIITSSLDSALRHIRDQKNELMIWADGTFIYLDRHQMKYCAILRLKLLFSEGFRFVLDSQVNRISHPLLNHPVAPTVTPVRTLRGSRNLKSNSGSFTD